MAKQRFKALNMFFRPFLK